MLQVEEIALLNTTLIRWDGSRVLYPNYKMNTDMITNITRSNNKVNASTPLQLSNIAALSCARTRQQPAASNKTLRV